MLDGCDENAAAAIAEAATLAAVAVSKKIMVVLAVFMVAASLLVFGMVIR